MKATFLHRTLAENFLLVSILILIIEILVSVSVAANTYRIMKYSYKGRAIMVVLDKEITNDILYPFKIEVKDDTGNKLVLHSAAAYFTYAIGDTVNVDKYINNHIYYYIPIVAGGDNQCYVYFLS